MKRDLPRIAFVIFIGAGVGVVSPPSKAQVADDDNESVDTGTTLAPQLCAQWCWASTVEMISNQLNISVPQCEVVSARYGAPHICCAPNACSTICNMGSGGPEVLTAALSFWGIHGNFAANALSEAALKRALATGTPVIAATFPHAFVVSGYRREGGHYVFHVLDPFTGESDERYIKLLNHGGFRWTFSWWGFHS